MRLTSILTAASVLVPLAAAAATASAATISPANVRFPQIAVNVGGATVVAWERRSGGAFAIEARAGDAPLRLGKTRRLAARGFAPQVAIGADGTRAVQWIEERVRGVRSVRVAVARPGHGFGKGQLLDRRRANMGTVAVAVQPDGRVVAVWRRTNTRLAYALAPRNRAFGTARELTTIGPVSTNTLALDPRDGAVVLAYGTPLRTSPIANQQAGARTLTTTATTFSAPVVVSDPAGLSEAHPVVVTGSGAAGVAYTQSGVTPSLRLARRKADGTWAASELVASPVLPADVYAVDPHATLPADGSALAAWSIDTNSPGGLGGSISKQTVASIAAPLAPFGAPQAVSPANAIFGATAIASARDEAFVATAKAHGPVLLATRGAAGTTLQSETLTADGDGDVLLAAAGTHVVAAWQRHDRLQLHIVR